MSEISDKDLMQLYKTLIDVMDIIKNATDLIKDRLKHREDLVDPDYGINKFCSEMPIKIAETHFKRLAIFKDKRTGESLLTSEQLNLFIRRAFCGDKTIPKLKFSRQEYIYRAGIKNEFYSFYQLTCLEYFGTRNVRDKYIRLLTENFEGWSYAKVKNNFSRSSSALVLLPI